MAEADAPPASRNRELQRPCQGQVVGTSPGQSDWAFSNWDAALGSLIAINEKAFTAATTAGTRSGSGWTRVVPVVGLP